MLAIIGAVVGEYLGGATGLGYLLVASMNNYKVGMLFAVILLLALNSSIVPVVIAAGIVLEVLLWRGVFGFGRSARGNQSR